MRKSTRKNVFANHRIVPYNIHKTIPPPPTPPRYNLNIPNTHRNYKMESQEGDLGVTFRIGRLRSSRTWPIDVIDMGFPQTQAYGESGRRAHTFAERPSSGETQVAPSKGHLATRPDMPRPVLLFCHDWLPAPFAHRPFRRSQHFDCHIIAKKHYGAPHIPTSSH